jgi:hypothetical protein
MRKEWENVRWFLSPTRRFLSIDGYMDRPLTQVSLFFLFLFLKKKKQIARLVAPVKHCLGSCIESWTRLIFKKIIHFINLIKFEESYASTHDLSNLIKVKKKIWSILSLFLLFFNFQLTILLFKKNKKNSINPYHGLSDWLTQLITQITNQ